jgi:hypothetical protein
MKRTLAIATAGLAAFVPTAAATHQPNHQPGTQGNLTIDATPDTVRFGRAVTLSGKLTGANNATRPVTIEHDPFPVDTFTPLGATTTNATGDWSFVHDSPAVNTRYRARSGGNESQIVTVGVRPAISLRLSDYTPDVGERVRFFGRLCPEHDGTRIAIQRRFGPNDWRTVRRTTLKDIAGSACSSYSRRVPVRRDGAYRVRFRGDADHVAGNSRVRRANVG